jgi:hypothetical protein
MRWDGVGVCGGGGVTWCGCGVYEGGAALKQRNPETVVKKAGATGLVGAAGV